MELAAGAAQVGAQRVGRADGGVAGSARGHAELERHRHPGGRARGRVMATAGHQQARGQAGRAEETLQGVTSSMSSGR